MAYANNGQSVSSFGLQIKRWTRKAKTRCDVVTREVNLRVGTRIIMRSPVDTGLFRGNWQAGIGNKPRGVMQIYDPSGQDAISRLSGVTNLLNAGDKFFFTNNLPYALALEYGHSSQAPAGMVRITLAEFHQITREAVAEAKAKTP